VTSRRGTLVEDAARGLLQYNGYTVQIVPPGFNKKLPPVHLIATHSSGETRFIRIQKVSRKLLTAESLDRYCSNDLVQLRKTLAGNFGVEGPRCEIWIYTLSFGFRCFEILPDDIREIPKLSQPSLAVTRSRGVA
jgi:hypothetical protein